MWELYIYVMCEFERMREAEAKKDWKAYDLSKRIVSNIMKAYPKIKKMVYDK